MLVSFWSKTFSDESTQSGLGETRIWMLFVGVKRDPGDVHEHRAGEKLCLHDFARPPWVSYQQGEQLTLERFIVRIARVKHQISPWPCQEGTARGLPRPRSRLEAVGRKPSTAAHSKLSLT